MGKLCFILVMLGIGIYVFLFTSVAENVVPTLCSIPAGFWVVAVLGAALFLLTRKRSD